MGDELKPDFRVEYAKSNRSRCAKCSNQIDQETVRVGKLERASNFDGEIFRWHHAKCFFQKHGALVSDASMLKGIDMLRWDDQQDLRKRGGFAAGSSGASAAAAADESSSEGDAEVIKCEYAKSAQSGCRGCGSKIGKGEVRVGAESHEGPYVSVSWHHVACWKVPKALKKADDIVGFNKLKADDKDTLKKAVDDAHKSAGSAGNKKRKATEAPEEAPDPKRAKIEAEARARSEKLWKIVDKLKGKYDNNELKAILKYNDQSTWGGPQELLLRVAEGELAGALPRCSECEKGHLSYDSGKIKCHGYLSAWSKCTFETEELDSIKRAKWKYPKNDELDDLVAELKEEKVREKEAAAAPPPVTSASTVFQDCVFTIIGSLPDKADVEYKIENHGGDVVASVTKKLTHVISTFEEVSKAKKTAKLNNAIKAGHPILDPLFLDHALNKGSLADQEKFLVWADGKPRQLDDTFRASIVPFSGIPKKKKMAIPPVDPQSEISEEGSILVDDNEVFGVMLNMTDLSVGQSGRNSFYVLQIIKHNSKASKFHLFRRWGRVGADGETKEENFKYKDDAIEEFKKVFFDKTKNHWEKYVHGQFEKQPGKFAPVELDGGDDDDVSLEEDKEALKSKLAKSSAASSAAAPAAKIDDRVAKLVKLVFDTDMILGVMKEMDIDIEKMPLGKLSKKAIKGGERLLEQIEAKLDEADKLTDEKDKKPIMAKIFDLTNQYYTTIPHDFGNNKPPMIDNRKLLQQKYDLLAALGDIEVAARMLEGGDAALSPLEQRYKMLKNDISAVEKDGEEWKRLEKYLKNTQEGWRLKIIDIFKVDRHEERELFAKHDALDNRHLLWHGSNVAVFAAILSGGLKIMPHSGGRVGRGLYFADMIAKSAGYCGLHGKIGLVLLNEVAMGKINKIRQDNSSLVKPPSGFDSVLAQGSTMPNSKDDYIDTTLSRSGKPVIIPQGKPHDPKGGATSFMHNEYLIYDQTQVNMKYLFMLEWEDRVPHWH